MARRRSRNRKGQRDATPIANPLPPVVVVRPPPIPSSVSLVRALQAQKLHQSSLPDRRKFTPKGIRTAKTIAGNLARFTPRLVRAAVRPTFNIPSRVLVCLRRKVRREVLHALRRTNGSGGGRKRNVWSNVRC